MALLLSLAFPPPVHAQIQQAWVARYNNGITNGQHRTLKMLLDGAGNIYLCGYSQNTNGGYGYATLKFAPNGQQLWVTRFDSTNFPTAQPTGMALDAQTNVLVTGNAVTAKYDRLGNPLWIAPQNAYGIAADQSNNVVITGVNSNYTTIKLTSGGTNIWSQTFTGPGPCLAQTVNIDQSNNIYVVGSEDFGPPQLPESVGATAIKYSASGKTLWTQTPINLQGTVNITASALGSLDDLYFTFDAVNRYPYLTCAYDSSGGGLWLAGDPTHDGYSSSLGLALSQGTNIVVTGKNAYYYPASSYGTYKISGGNYVWTNLYPAVPKTTGAATAVAADSVGNCYVTGYSPGADTGNNIVTIAYDSNGNQLWLQRYDGPAHGDDAGKTIAVDTNGNVYVAGYDTPIGGGTEMVLIKYSPVTVKHEANGDFQLQAQGAASEPFDIQASTNLSSWQDLGDFDADTNGLLQYTDTNAGQFPARFYQAIPQ